jgi:HD-GYP domain-containing protein (c-di-GMP phosphodiesterase class II)
MTLKRAWRPALAVDEALAVIAAERGQQFDPALADAFIQMVRQLTLTHGDTLDEFLAGGSHSSPTLAIRKAILRRTSS